jgi:hypothetical protein
MLEDRCGQLVKTRVLRQGDNSLSFYELEDASSKARSAKIDLASE